MVAIKPKTWTYEQQIEYELALDTLSSLEAILRRQSRIITDKDRINKYKQRALELHKESRKFDGFDDGIVKDVNDTYSALIREYHTMGDTEEEIATIGLPDKFITIKVDYDR